jgi:hypothetical protein
VLLQGTTGSGKSTFIQSLIWRKHLGVARLISIDCSELPDTNKLPSLASQLQKVCENARGSQGMTAVSVDYMESLGGIAPEEKRAFFQTLNGLLRKSPVLVVWPVTTGNDANAMLQEARAVSSTLFDNAYPILGFTGPNSDSFPTIARNTISVFNGGRLLQDFLLTDAELENVRDKLLADRESLPSIRNFLERIYGLWSTKTGRLSELTAKLPKPNEVWCVFCYPTAEDIVTTFATKGNHPPSAWIAYHAKLWEYIPDTQREARWKNPTRLQYAISGAFTSRILHLSPQALVSAVMAYGTEPKLDPIKHEGPLGWSNRSSAKKHMKTSAMYRQLTGEPPSKGKTKGGPAAIARLTATPSFERLNKIVAGTGNDRHVNQCVASCLRDVLPNTYSVFAETAHPWIPSIVPDIRVDMPDGRQICIEFCYTNNAKPGAVSDYALDKMVTYMEQLEQFVGAGIAQA